MDKTQQFNNPDQTSSRDDSGFTLTSDIEIRGEKIEKKKEYQEKKIENLLRRTSKNETRI